MTLLNPKFLTKNEINAVSKITDSAGNSDDMKRRLFDRNSEIQYQTVGQISGTRTITFTPNSATSINRIFIQNCNWKTFTIKYNTSSDFSVSITVTNGTATNYYFEFNSVSVDNVVFSITDTHISADVAKVGQIYTGTELFTIAEEEGGLFKVVPSAQQVLIQLSDGSYSKCYIRTIINYELTLSAVSTANISNYRNLFLRNRTEAFAFIPRPTTIADTGDGFTEWDGIGNHYHWANAPDYYNYTDYIIDNGYDVNIELKQAAGV